MRQRLIFNRKQKNVHSGDGLEYLMEIEQYYGRKFRFQVTAYDESDALITARNYIDHLPDENRENCIMDSLHVVRKLKPQFGSQLKQMFL